MRRTMQAMMLAMVFGLFASALYAQDKPAASGEPKAVPEAAKWVTPGDVGRGLAILGACVGAGLAVVGGGIGIGRVGGDMVSAVARQPEASGTMFTVMIITAAMIEGGMLFAIVLSLLSVLWVK